MTKERPHEFWCCVCERILTRDDFYYKKSGKNTGERCGRCRNCISLINKGLLKTRDKRFRINKYHCYGCDTIKTKDDFYYSKKTNIRLRYCKECSRIRLNTWRQKNKGPDKRYRKNQLYCSGCSLVKKKEDFLYNKNNKRQAYCNNCRLERCRKYNSSEAGRKKKKEYYNTSAGKMVLKKSLENQIKKDPLFFIKKKARCAVQEELRRKKIAHPTTLKCFDCNKQANEYDHYLGYDEKNWLSVQPICWWCHSKRTMEKSWEKN